MVRYVCGLQTRAAVNTRNSNTALGEVAKLATLVLLRPYGVFILPRISTGAAVANPARASPHVSSPTPTAADNKSLHNKLSLQSASCEQNKTFAVTLNKVLRSERAAV